MTNSMAYMPKQRKILSKKLELLLLVIKLF